MSLAVPYVLLFVTAALVAAGALVAALAKGRERSPRTWAWVTGLVIAVLGTAFHLLIAVGATIASGQVTWLLLGTLALVCATVLAFVRPRWAAWLFAGTAVVIPLAIAAINAALTPSLGDEMPALVVAGFYSVRSLAAAAFLWLSTLPVRAPVTGGRPPASPSPAPRSETVPTG